jgi:hypothetical protein
MLSRTHTEYAQQGSWRTGGSFLYVLIADDAAAKCKSLQYLDSRDTQVNSFTSCDGVGSLGGTADCNTTMVYKTAECSWQPYAWLCYGILLLVSDWVDLAKAQALIALLCLTAVHS